MLLVEDDERIRASMRLALEDEGYEIDEAGTGEEGLATFGHRPADVVLIDLMLPGMDGLECCRALRRISAVPVVDDSGQIVGIVSEGDLLRRAKTTQSTNVRGG